MVCSWGGCSAFGLGGGTRVPRWRRADGREVGFGLAGAGMRRMDLGDLLGGRIALFVALVLDFVLGFLAVVGAAGIVRPQLFLRFEQIRQQRAEFGAHVIPGS